MLKSELFVLEEKKNPEQNFVCFLIHIKNIQIKALSTFVCGGLWGQCLRLLLLHNCRLKANSERGPFFLLRLLEWSSRCPQGRALKTFNQWEGEGRGRERAGYFYWAKSVHLCLASTHITAHGEHPAQGDERDTSPSVSLTHRSSHQRQSWRSLWSVSVRDKIVLVCFHHT